MYIDQLFLFNTEYLLLYINYLFINNNSFSLNRSCDNFHIPFKCLSHLIFKTLFPILSLVLFSDIFPSHKFNYISFHFFTHPLYFVHIFEKNILYVERFYQLKMLYRFIYIQYLLPLFMKLIFHSLETEINDFFSMSHILI